MKERAFISTNGGIQYYQEEMPLECMKMASQIWIVEKVGRRQPPTQTLCLHAAVCCSMYGTMYHERQHDRTTIQPAISSQSQIQQQQPSLHEKGIEIRIIHHPLHRILTLRRQSKSPQCIRCHCYSSWGIEGWEEEEYYPAPQATTGRRRCW